MDKLAAIILAAGQGKRMKSLKPKVLHKAMGKPLVRFPTEMALGLGCSPLVLVVGHGRDLVESDVRGIKGGNDVAFSLQTEQLGTGHAVMMAAPKLKGYKGPVLILSGDVPLLDRQSINKLKKAYTKIGAEVAFLTFCPEDPTGYGRVIREGGTVVAIREHKDCNSSERNIEEVNSGIYLIDSAFLKRSIKNLDSSNKQGEFYLTDLVEKAAKKGVVPAIEVDGDIVHGVNDRVDLAEIEEIMSEQTNLGLMRQGVTIQKPYTVRIDVDVKVGRDTEIGANVSLIGTTKVGKGCIIETGAVITNSQIKDNAVIKAYSVIDDAEVGSFAEIGPMGRLRPGAIIKENAKVGNFVELKNTVLGPGSKANHLAYLGDGDIGKGVNVGAGTIFCNYDGFQKHKTVLEDDVFIGSDSQLVAPVKVGHGAYVASGSTVTKDVPPDALAVSRAKQENKKGVGAVLKRRFKALKEKSLKLKSKGK